MKYTKKILLYVYSIYSRLQDKGYHRPSYLFETGSEPLLSLTVGQLIDWAAEEYADNEALVSVYENVRWTFKEAKEKADRLAAGFLALGLNPGDVIALWGFNSSYFYLTALAAARAGLILAKVDPSNQAPELRHCLNKVGAKLLIAAETDVTQNYYKIVHSLAPELGHCAVGQLRSEQLPELRTVVMTGDLTHPGTYHFDQIIKMATPEGNARVQEMQSSIQPDDGTTIHYTSFKAVDKEGKMVPMGSPGELWVRGYIVMLGYWGDEAKTRETITADGWLKTGDQVILLENGHCRIAGRIKEAIIRGSDNIFPKEIEDLFINHPDIVDAQVFGVPDARWGEEICLYVRPRKGSDVTEEHLKAYCKGKADRLAAGFLSLGLNPGDVIAVWGFNSSHFYLTSLAAARAGLILAKVDPSNQAPELRHCLNKVGAKLLIAAETDVTQNYYKIIHSLAPELDHCMAGQLRSEQLPELRTVVMTGDLTHPSTYNLDDLITMATSEGIAWLLEIQKSIQPDDGTAIHYTSGTTGSPKGALLSHLYIINAGYWFGRQTGMKKPPLKNKLTKSSTNCSIISGIAVMWIYSLLESLISRATLLAETVFVKGAENKMFLDKYMPTPIVDLYDRCCSSLKTFKLVHSMCMAHRSVWNFSSAFIVWGLRDWMIEDGHVLPKTCAVNNPVVPFCKIGFFPADQLPARITRPATLVINTDPHTNPGTLWITIFIDENGVGEPFEIYCFPLRIKSHLVFTRKNISSTSRRTLQLKSISSDICELRVLGSYKLIISNFSATHIFLGRCLTNHEISLRRMCGDSMVVISEKQDADSNRLPI
uniref:Medium-chain acyl-CoA ligase ACSF2, mitochondrial n=1 Tax=Timema cristinae TaxID=61476 RepID=A0A7R9H4C9_TIMCR|nr:unnamed protein product [Timema cristinae]